MHPDQSSFMPGRGVDINKRRLFTHIDLAEGGNARVVAALDVGKSVRPLWVFLWMVLGCFGFSPKFISWMQLLYTNPTARVQVNGMLSDPFNLCRGTRQGCPLSPGLYFLTIEPWQSFCARTLG